MEKAGLMEKTELLFQASFPSMPEATSQVYKCERADTGCWLVCRNECSLTTIYLDIMPLHCNNSPSFNQRGSKSCRAILGMLPVGKFSLISPRTGQAGYFFSCYFPHYNPELMLVWKAIFSHCSKYLPLFIQNTVKQLKSHMWGKQTPRKTARLPTRPCLNLSTSLAHTGGHWVETMLEGRTGCPKQNDFREQCWLRSGKGWEHPGQNQPQWPYTRMYISLFKMKTKIIFLLILHRRSQTFKGSVFKSEPLYPVLHTVPLCQIKTLTLEKNIQPKT